MLRGQRRKELAMTSERRDRHGRTLSRDDRLAGLKTAIPIGHDFRLTNCACDSKRARCDRIPGYGGLGYVDVEVGQETLTPNHPQKTCTGDD